MHEILKLFQYLSKETRTDGTSTCSHVSRVYVTRTDMYLSPVRNRCPRDYHVVLLFPEYTFFFGYALKSKKSSPMSFEGLKKNVKFRTIYE